MPYKRYDPAPESDMEKQMKNDNTICNTIRAMYHMTNDVAIRDKCRVAFSMGKKMCEKLAEYHDKYNSPMSELMALRKRDPAPEWEMDKQRWEGHHSICQTIRDIYHMTTHANLQLECRNAMAMTKAMHEKLKEYKLRETMRECCNADCGWIGQKDRCVHQPHSPEELLCPECHEVTEETGGQDVNHSG